jgi:ATP synthase protein I
MAGTLNPSERPEREMVRRAAGPAAAAFVVATTAGALQGGAGAAASAGIGIVVVALNFAANGLSLAWASTISVTAVQVVAFVGFILRLVVVVAVMFALNTLSWFSPVAFGLAVVPATVLLLAYEARLALRGLGAGLQIPADPAAERAATALAAREAH